MQRLVRTGGGIRWNPERDEIDRTSLEGFDAVLHLAGENIACRWTTAARERIRRSRVDGTHLLAAALASLDRPPRVLISASAIGYYGDRGEEILDERSDPGVGFLAEVCREWEAAARPAVEAGIRVLHPRIGMVLGRGGALARMLPIFRLGLGGSLGNGRQYVSWITLEDLLGTFAFSCERTDLIGPLNAVAPQPVSNRRFTKILAAVLHRPAVLPAPAWGMRLLFGSMADELLLAGARVAPAALETAGYRFHDPELERALARICGPSC